MPSPSFSVSDFVAVLNQTLEFAYPSATIVGELANFRVSKNRWVYFDLKDENSSVKFFGTVYMLPGPLEDGMMLEVQGSPRLHNLYGFSVNVLTMKPVGEGSLKRAAELLQAKLTAEGLFDQDRKRALPYPPSRIGLITSGESAAYADFVKILQERWAGVIIEHYDVQVQGDAAVPQIVAALEHFNQMATPPEVLVVTRGGGSAEDLAAFSTEQVTRAVAGSRIPTIVAIGHEVDLSLAELAADQRASTPSNAAQLLVPDKRHVLEQLDSLKEQLAQAVVRAHQERLNYIEECRRLLGEGMERFLRDFQQSLTLRSTLLTALSPTAALQRGYALVRLEGKTVRSVKNLAKNAEVRLQFADGEADASITSIEPNGGL
jgi:exodeoxyribonuclease VII large subunit